MNRNQRRYGRIHQEIFLRAKKQPVCIEEVLPPSRKGPPTALIAAIDEVSSPRGKVPPSGRPALFKEVKQLPMTNRCCYFTPEQKEFGHVTEISDIKCCHVTPEQKEFGLMTEVSNNDQYRNITPDLFGYSAINSNTVANELRKLLSANSKVESCSQYINPVLNLNTNIDSRNIETSDGPQWQNIEDVEDIERIFNLRSDSEREKKKQSELPYETLYISDIPRVKIIAEKFTRYKKNNIQLRTLDEKVVCVEYDVFQRPEDPKPAQVMRAFYSFKPLDDEKEKILTQLPSHLKNKFNISPSDLSKLNEKEIEIIDGKLAENLPYLDDLRKILRRKENAAKISEHALNLQSLYEIARKDCMHFDRDGTTVLSMKELQEVKDLILKNSKSSAHGINRKTVRNNEAVENIKISEIISRSIVSELFDNNKDIVN